MSDPTEEWNEEQTYDERISPLMKQIIAICKERNIPVFACFAYEWNAEDGHGFCTTHIQKPERIVPEFHRMESIAYGTAGAFTLRTTDAKGNIIREERILP